MNRLVLYYRLAKPGIIRGNLLTATAGFLLASKGHVEWWLLVKTLAGTACIIGSACVFNNYLDRGIDARMKRTAKRALVTGEISNRAALAYATILGVLGLFISLSVNSLMALVGLIGFVSYVGLYSYFKRRSVHGTLVGTISGATPPVAGYVAAGGQFDAGALLLFLLMVCWQMPHFYAIAIYRYKDYKAAGLPVMPVKKDVYHTRLAIRAYIIGFIVVALLFTALGYTGPTFSAAMLAAGLVWLWMDIHSRSLPDRLWGRNMFLYSLLVVTLMSATLSLNQFLP